MADDSVKSKPSTNEYVVLQHAAVIRVGNARDAVVRLTRRDKISLVDDERTKRLLAQRVIGKVGDKATNRPVNLREALDAVGAQDDPVKQPDPAGLPLEEAPTAPPVAPPVAP